MKRKDWVCTKCLLKNKHDSNNCIRCYQKRNLPESQEQKPAFNFSSASLEPHVPDFSSISNNFIFGSIISSESSSSQKASPSIQVDVSNLGIENNHNHSNNSPTAPSQTLEPDTLAQGIIISTNTSPKYTTIQGQCHFNAGMTVFLRTLPVFTESETTNSNIKNPSYANNSPRNILVNNNTSTSFIPRRTEIQETMSSTRNSSVFDNLSVSNIFNQNHDVSTHNSSISSLSSNTNTSSLTPSNLTSINSTSTNTTRRVNPRNGERSRSFFTILKETFSYSIITIGRLAMFSFIFFFFIIIFFYILFLYISSNYNF